MEQLNPYLPPKAGLHPAGSHAEETRQLHLEHEAGVRGLGLFILLVGLAMVWGAGLDLFSQLKRGVFSASFPGSAAWFLIGLSYLIIGPGLRGLRRWAHRAAVVVEAVACVVTLLGPDPTIGFIFHAAVGLSLLGPRTRRVVSPDYRRIMAATPKVKKKTSSVAWALLGLLLILLMGIGAAYLGAYLRR